MQPTGDSDTEPHANAGAAPFSYQAADNHLHITSLASLAEHVSEAVLLIGLDGQVLYANPAYHTMTGAVGVLAGTPLHHLHADPPALVDEILAAVQQHQLWQGLCSYRCNDGTTLRGHLVAVLLRATDGTPQAIAALLHHVTEQGRAVEALRNAHSTLARRVQERDYTMQRTSALLQAKLDDLHRLQASLRSSETRQRTLLHALPDALLVLNHTGTILDAHLPGDFAARHPQPLVGQHVSVLTPEHATTPIMHLIAQVLHTGETHQHEYKQLCGTTQHHYQIRIVPAHIESVLMLIHEITAQRSLENDLAQFFRLSPDLMVIVGEYATIKHCNSAWESVLGYPEADLIGQHILDFIHPDDAATALQAADQLLAGQLISGIETRYRHRDGSYRWLRWRAVCDPNTMLIHALAQDISAERTTHQLRALLNEAIHQHSEAVLILSVGNEPDSVCVKYANPCFVQLAGAPLQPDQPFRDLQTLWGTAFTDQIVHCTTQRDRQAGTLIITSDKRYQATWRFNPLHCTHEGQQYFLLELHNITPYAASRYLAETQLGVLEAIIQSEPLESVLNRIATMIEQYMPHTRTVLQVIANGKVVRRAAPRLSPHYSADIQTHYPHLYLDIDQQVQPGTPCASALATGQPILISDISESTNWPVWREIAQRYGLHACWTAPIRHAANDPAGVMVVYSTKPGAPDEHDLALMNMSCHLASLTVERLYLNDQLQYQSLHDALTGLPNRAGFEHAVEQALAALPGTTHQVVLGIINLDRFKQINTGLGVQVGDVVIRLVAQRLRTLVEPLGMLARLSGDEFALLLPQAHTIATAHELARSLLHALRAPFVIDDLELIITASIGLSSAPSDATTTSGLLQCADWAMTRAKAEGANQVLAFMPGMSAFAREQLELEQQLHLALHNNELLLYYQPQWDIQRGQIYGVEALIRWQHPLRGFLEAGKFLPVAEAGGLTFAIGSWVLNEACRQAAEWYRAGHCLRISVNISAAQLMHPDFITSLQAILDRYQLPADLLELELIEGTALQDHATGAQRLHDVRALGTRIAIDDFGTGYSSLAYLQRFRVDSLKIDRSFVSALDTADLPADDTVPLVQTIISLAHNFRLTVVAEGVETDHQLHFLKHAGCEVVQGHLTGKPMPASMLDALLHHELPLPLRNGTHPPNGRG